MAAGGDGNGNEERGGAGTEVHGIPIVVWGASRHRLLDLAGDPGVQGIVTLASSCRFDARRTRPRCPRIVRRRDPTVPFATCLDEDQILLLLEGTLPADARAEATKHL